MSTTFDAALVAELAGQVSGSILAHRTEEATATAEGGVIWAELNDAAAAQYGLAVTGGGLRDGNRRLHARRRPRLADGEIWTRR